MNATTQNQRYALQELEKEALMGAEGEETFAREVRCIDLSNFAQEKMTLPNNCGRRREIGFFQVSHHGIPLADIRQAFSMTEAFFDLPDEVKRQYPLAGNAGWESKAQVRPSTRTPDQKESYQITRPLDGRALAQRSGVASIPADDARVWPQCWQLGMKILSCFALKLGFPESFFTTAHDPQRDTYQSTLRMLHYYATEQSQQGMWRAARTPILTA